MNGKTDKETKVIPYSGRIVGTIVEALDIKDEVLTSRTARRYYSGKTVSTYSLKQIYTVLGENLVELGITPAPAMFEKHGVSMPVIVTASISRLARKWDQLCARIQSRSARIGDYSQAAKGFCRLIVIDLALRIVSWLRLDKSECPEPTTPIWAEENGAGKMLREFLSETGITREQLAARVGVTRVSIDNWFDGKIRPVPENIEFMVEEFANLIPGTNKNELRQQLQRQFTLAYLVNILAETIGRKAVVELATALYRFIYLISEDIRTMTRPPIEEVAGMEYDNLRLGTDDPGSHTLLRNLSVMENNPEWQRDILASITGWDLRFEEIANFSGLLSDAAGLAQELPREVMEQDIKEGIAEEIQRLRGVSILKPEDYERVISGDLSYMVERFKDGIDDRRLIVKRHPLSAQAHSQLGSFLGMVGRWLRNREMIDEGINECKISAALCEGWDMPLVEVGIILINAGHYDEALVEFENAANKLPELTPHLAMNRGYTLMQLKRYKQALADFEFVIAKKPDYSYALDYAAYCSFMLGNQVKGIKYAKEARKYGVMQSYNEWRNGVYKKQKL